MIGRDAQGLGGLTLYLTRCSKLNTNPISKKDINKKEREIQDLISYKGETASIPQKAHEKLFNKGGVSHGTR
jgi:hypothetical protein